MTNQRHSSTIAPLAACGLLCGALLCAAGPSVAGDRPGAIGGGGELYLTESGAYGDLFPGTPAPGGLAATSQVLALDILTAGAPTRRVMIPGGDGSPDGSALEGTPTLLYEDATRTLYAVWAIRVSALKSALFLASFDGAAWSEPISITGNPFATKVSPRLAVTRDTYLDSTVTPPVTRARTVLHLAWAEADANGLLQISYTPLIFEDGAFLGFDPSTIQNLNSLDTGQPTGLPVAPDLVAALNLQSGRDGRTVVASFAAVTTGRLDTVEIDVLPRELSIIADQVRTQVRTFGARYYPSHMQDLAAIVATSIFAIGSDFHPDVLQPIADRVHDTIAGWSSGSLQNLGDKLRSMIIDLGFHLSGRGLILAPSASPGQMVQAAPSPSSALQLVGAASSSATPPSATSQWLQFRVASSRPVPAVGGSGLHVLASQTGKDALVAWQPDAGHVVYTTSQAGGWSDPRTIELSDKLTLDQALAFLQQHLR